MNLQSLAELKKMPQIVGETLWLPDKAYSHEDLDHYLTEESMPCLCQLKEGLFLIADAGQNDVLLFEVGVGASRLKGVFASPPANVSCVAFPDGSAVLFGSFGNDVDRTGSITKIFVVNGKYVATTKSLSSSPHFTVGRGLDRDMRPKICLNADKSGMMLLVRDPITHHPELLELEWTEDVKQVSAWPLPRLLASSLDNADVVYGEHITHMTCINGILWFVSGRVRCNQSFLYSCNLKAEDVSASWRVTAVLLKKSWKKVQYSENYSTAQMIAYDDRYPVFLAPDNGAYWLRPTKTEFLGDSENLLYSVFA